MNKLKGGAVLSETILNTLSLVISFILIISVVYGLFFTQSEKTNRNAFRAIARDIGFLIDRTAALAGSQEYEYNIPEGVNVNLSIGYKKIYLSYDKGTIEESFSGLIHSGPYHFVNPKKLCLVKNRDDRRIIISAGNCSCNFGDGVCDPACIINKVCDPDCRTEKMDYICNKFCDQNKDQLCDPDCYRNEVDKVCDFDCIKKNKTDGICDPDCDNVEKGICDFDCVMMFNGTTGYEGTCDPDCKPADKDSDGFEDEKDGYCYTGCAMEKKLGIIRLPKDGICDLDCNETNNICDPDCRLDDDCEEKCSIENEDCSKIPCCAGYVCCPGTKLCAKEKDYEPACCGDEKCDVSPILRPLYDELEASGWKRGSGKTYKDYEQKMWNLTSLPKNWENWYTCQDDCWSGDLVCNRKSVSGKGDIDCESYCKPGNGNHKWDCCSPYYTAHPSYQGHPNYYTCPYHSTSTEDYIQSRPDGICTQVEDNVCDPDCVNDNTSCDPDCCGFNTPNPCPTSPGCYCPVRVKKSDNFAGGLYITNTKDNNWMDDVPHLTPNVIQVCSDEVIKFLDRRGWDIKQIEVELKSPDPLGFAFDEGRYGGGEEDISKTGVYKASKTILANEKYNLTKPWCNSILTNEKEICAGVGFCGDHAIALVSILRTLGVPPYDVYAAFSSCDNCRTTKGTGFRHAYVLYYCDPSLPNNLKLRACNGNWNKWLQIDATNHYIVPFEGTALCEHLCLVWNDYGAYPLINKTKYGFGGLIDKNSGYPFPIEGPRKLNCKVDPTCILNTNDQNRPGFCELLKNINFKCIW